MGTADSKTAAAFRLIVLDYYQEHGRHDLPWRIPNGGFDPYKIMVSELMLQQTQVSRVIPKYQAFLQTFPTIESLAAASLREVLTAWSGLGYNRRAQYLQRAAQGIVHDFGGQFPRQLQQLTKLPGIGSNTAGAILAYAFNEPSVFIETNIRTIYIHHFFTDDTQVSDRAILDLVHSTLDKTNPRLWYWALMDYGTFLKQSVGTSARRSTSYARQTPFIGSQRQIRGQVIKLLSVQSLSRRQLTANISDVRLPSVLEALLAEKMITESPDGYCL